MNLMEHLGQVLSPKPVFIIAVVQFTELGWQT